MKMVANETELRNALKEKAPEITIVTSYADTVKKKYGVDTKNRKEQSRPPTPRKSKSSIP